MVPWNQPHDWLLDQRRGKADIFCFLLFAFFGSPCICNLNIPNPRPPQAVVVLTLITVVEKEYSLKKDMKKENDSIVVLINIGACHANILNRIASPPAVV